MKRVISLIIIVFFLGVHTSTAQNMEATKQYLETQIEILRLQETLDAMQSPTGSGNPYNNNDDGSGIGGSKTHLIILHLPH